MDIEKKRFTDIDVMKVFAVFFVIFNHTGDNGFSLFIRYDPRTVPFVFFLFLSVFCKFAVPLFLMLSGALLLSKEKLELKYVLKRILKVVLVLIVFGFIRSWAERYRSIFREIYAPHEYSTFDYVINSLKHGKYPGNTCASLLKRIFTGDYVPDFDFLYIYLQYLFVLPVLFAFSGRFQKWHFYGLSAAAVFFCGILPCLTFYFTKDPSAGFPDFMRRVFLCFVPVLGYYVEFKMKDVSNKGIIALWGVNVLTIGISAYLTYLSVYGQTKTPVFSEDYHNMFYVFNALTICVTFKKYCKNVPSGAEKLFAFLSKSVLTVYLMHINLFYLLPPITSKIGGYAEQSLFLPAVFLLTGYILLDFACCVLIWWGLSKIPVLKRLTYL